MIGHTRDRFGTTSWIVAFSVVLVSTMVLNENTFSSHAASASLSGQQLYRGLILAHGPVADLIPEIRDNYRLRNFVSEPDDLAMIEAVQNRVIQGIDRLDPSFFAAFRTMIRSGDHKVIDWALKQAGDITIQAVRNIPEVASLRQQMRNDPSRRDALLSEIRSEEGMEQISGESLELAVDLVLADSLDGLEAGAEGGGEAAIVVVIVTVAAIVAAITVILAQSYAAVLNIATAVNVAAALVAWTAVYRPNNIALLDPDVAGANSLFRDQLVHSIATKLPAR
jgi:SdpC family antimicrobial peptide